MDGIRSEDAPLVAALAVLMLAAFLVTRPRQHLSLVLALSGVGFSLAVVYELLGAPDVALVAVLVETILTVLFVGVLARFPHDVLRREAALSVPRSRRWRDPLVGALAGLAALLTVWAGLSRPVPADSSAERHIALVDDAHGKDVGVAFVPALFGDAPLQHVPPPGADVVTIGSLELITAVLFDVGVFALVVGVCVAVIGFLAAEAAEEQTP